MNADGLKPASQVQISQLLEQLMMIARASALEEMASGFAHELNQPIGAIATFAQAAERMLARAEPMTGAAVDVLKHISNEALNAGQGIRRIRKLFNDGTVERSVCALPDILAELMPKNAGTLGRAPGEDASDAERRNFSQRLAVSGWQGAVACWHNCLYAPAIRIQTCQMQLTTIPRSALNI